MKIAIDPVLCSGCNRCAQVCPLNFSETPRGKPEVADPVLTCFHCGHCVAVCPEEAVSHDGLSDLRFTPLRDLPAPAQFMSLLHARRSRREFTLQPLSREEIDALLTAGAQAANGLNRRDVGYTVVTEPATLKELSRRIGKQTLWMAARLESPLWRLVFRMLMGRGYKELEPLFPLFKPMASALPRGRDMILYDAPCAILIHTRPGDPCGAENAVYSGANILLAAEAMGLGACVIGFLTEPVNRSQDLARLAGVPPGHKVHTSIVAGHPRFPYARGIAHPAPQGADGLSRGSSSPTA